MTHELNQMLDYHDKCYEEDSMKPLTLEQRDAVLEYVIKHYKLRLADGIDSADLKGFLNTQESEFDPTYYWEHMSEEHKYSICRKIDRQIAKRMYAEYLVYITNNNCTELHFVDWLDREED